MKQSLAIYLLVGSGKYRLLHNSPPNRKTIHQDTSVNLRHMQALVCQWRPIVSSHLLRFEKSSLGAAALGEVRCMLVIEGVDGCRFS